MDLHRLRLANSIQTPDSLLHHRRAPRQVVVHQVVRELEVASLTAELGGDEHQRPFRIPESGHLAIARHQRQLSVVGERLDCLGQKLLLQPVERLFGLGEHQNLGLRLAIPHRPESAEKGDQLGVPGGQPQLPAQRR